MLYWRGESTTPKGTEHTVDKQYICKKKIHLHISPQYNDKLRQIQINIMVTHSHY